MFARRVCAPRVASLLRSANCARNSSLSSSSLRLCTVRNSSLSSSGTRFLHSSCVPRMAEGQPEEAYQATPGSSEEFRGMADKAAPEQASMDPLDPKVDEIFNEILGLNLVQVNQLVNALKDKFGFVDTPMVAAAAAPVGGAGAAAEAGEAEEDAAPVKSMFEVKLSSFDAKKKIAVIKEVRAATGLGLKESKELVEGAPTTVLKDLPKDEAEALLEKIKAAGGEGEIV